MDLAFITASAQLGGTVFTVVAFLWFLSKLLNDINTRQAVRDKDQIVASDRQSDTNIRLATALENLSNKVNVNSDANIKNTQVIKENVSAVIDNTEAVSKNGK